MKPPKKIVTPKVTWKSPSQNPTGTDRAQKITDMFSVTVSSVVFRYEVGQANDQVQQFAVRNNTQSNALKISLKLPSYLVTAQAREFIISPTETIRFSARLNDVVARQLVTTGRTVFDESIEVEAEPLNITGPVYVLKKLEALRL